MAPWPPVATMNRNIADAYVDVELLWREGILDMSARGELTVGMESVACDWYQFLMVWKPAHTTL